MAGLYVLFMTVLIIVLVIDYAAQYRPPDRETPSDATETQQRAEGDDAA